MRFRMPRLGKLNRTQTRLWETLQFLIRFAVLSIPLYIVLWLNPDMSPAQRLVAEHSAMLLRSLSFPVSIENLVLSVGNGTPFLVYIGPDCIGWKSMFLFTALVLASTGIGIRKRAVGIAVGVPLIYLGNLARIIVVVVVERSYGLDAALIFHDWLWQAGMIAMVLALWLIWLKSGNLKDLLVCVRERLG